MLVNNLKSYNMDLMPLLDNDYDEEEDDDLNSGIIFLFFFNLFCIGGKR